MGVLSRRFRAAVIMFLILIGVWMAVYLPPYERLVYANSIPRGYDAIREELYCAQGYKGGADVPVIDARDGSQRIPTGSAARFVLKINVENLKPMGIYRPAGYTPAYTEYETSVLPVMLLRTKERYGQYYMATFANGEQIPVFLDDRLVRVPRSGELTLPIGSVSMDGNLEKVIDIPQGGGWYIDAASGFERSYEMARFQDIQTLAAAGLMIVAFIVVIIIMIIMQVRRRQGT